MGFYAFGRQDLFGVPSQETLLIVLAVLIGVVLVAGIVAVVSYVLSSLSLYTIAKRREIRGAGWAWVPVVGIDWIIGKIADRYELRQTGREKKFARKLLVLSCIMWGMFIIVYAVTFVWIGIMVGVELNGGMVEEYLLPMFLSLYGVILVMTVIAMVTAIIEYVALFKVYESAMPRKAIGLLVCTMLFGALGLAICLTVIRNKDLGYAVIENREKEIMKRYLPEENSQEEQPAEA